MATIKVEVNVLERHTTPDPVRVGQGDIVEWYCDNGAKLQIQQIEQAPRCTCGAPNQPFRTPGPPYPAGGPAVTVGSRPVDAAAVGHQYKTRILVSQDGQPIIIDPHIWVGG